MGEGDVDEMEAVVVVHLDMKLNELDQGTVSPPDDLSMTLTLISKTLLHQGQEQSEPLARQKIALISSAIGQRRVT